MMQFVDIYKAGCDGLWKSSGAGSRGGRVIGHTASGKPVYEHKNAMHYAHFTDADHKDAADLHTAKAKKINGGAKNYRQSGRTDGNKKHGSSHALDMNLAADDHLRLANSHGASHNLSKYD